MRLEVFKPRMIAALIALSLGAFGLCCATKESRMREMIKDLKPQILEFENVAGYDLKLNPSTKLPENISGFCFRSMYCVTGITTRTNDSVLIVLVQIAPCKEGQTGSFSFPLKIESNIRELRFGAKEHVLWTRQ